MLDEQLRESQFPRIWDNTMKTTLWTCPRKFYWFQRGYDYATRPAYFTWGSAWQEILVYWYENMPEGWLDPKSPAYWVIANSALEKGQEFYQNNIGATEPNTENSLGNLEDIWVNYLREHPSEPWKMIPGGSEVGWVWPIKGTDYFMAGSLDGYIEWDPYGVLVLENKSTGEYLSDGFVSRWDFSPQITGYVWYLAELRGHENVFGALMNLVTKKRPGPKSSWKTPRTTRSLVKKSKDELAEFREQTLWTIELAETYWKNWFWPKTQDPTYCTGGTGKAPCLYKHVCNIDGIPYTKFDPLTISGITLRDEAWEPWTRRGGQS